MEAKVVNMKGEATGTAELPEGVFGLRPRTGLLHEAVIRVLANRRRWTANTKTRSEVRGGGRKPWKQKHTGRARAGTIRSPLWRKGGVVFGPRAMAPSLKRIAIPRRKAAAALAQALSARARPAADAAPSGSIIILDSLALDGAKTRQVAELLRLLGAGPRPLVVLDQHDANLARAGRNIPGLSIRLASHLNAYDILRASRVVITRAALAKIRPLQ